jgi:hypothetical protein
LGVEITARDAACWTLNATLAIAVLSETVVRALERNGDE